jgi:dCMP deaminase
MTKKNLHPNKKKNDSRITKEQYYLNIAREVGKRGTCLRRNFGAIIVKEDQIISTGYSGAPRETINCTDINMCLREAFSIPKGENYELCRGVHAEQNAIIHASRLDMLGATLYLVGMDVRTGKIMTDAEPCRLCKRMIINAGIKKVIIQLSKGKVKTQLVKTWVKNSLGEIKSKGKTFRLVMPSGY